MTLKKPWWVLIPLLVELQFTNKVKMEVKSELKGGCG